MMSLVTTRAAASLCRTNAIRRRLRRAASRQVFHARYPRRQNFFSDDFERFLRLISVKFGDEFCVPKRRKNQAARGALTAVPAGVQSLPWVTTNGRGERRGEGASDGRIYGANSLLHDARLRSISRLSARALTSAVGNVSHAFGSHATGRPFPRRQRSRRVARVGKFRGAVRTWTTTVPPRALYGAAVRNVDDGRAASRRNESRDRQPCRRRKSRSWQGSHISTRRMYQCRK